MSRGSARIAIALTMLLAAACDRRADAKKSGSAAPASSAPLGPDLVSWEEPPAPWTRIVVDSPVRRATWLIPREDADPDDAECAIFAYPQGSGGSAEDVIGRWIQEFAQTEPITVRRADRPPPMQQDLVEIRGTWLAPALPGRVAPPPRRGWALLGIAVHTLAGMRYVRMVGPATAIERNQGVFQALVTSFHLRP